MPAALCAAGWLGRKGIFRSVVRKAGREELHLRPFLKRAGGGAAFGPLCCPGGRRGCLPDEHKTTAMTATDTRSLRNEQQNRRIAQIVSILRKYGAIEFARQGIVVHVAFADPAAEAAETDGGRVFGTETDRPGKEGDTVRVKTMQVEEIEYTGEGSFAVRVTEAPDGTRLTKKAAAALRAQTEQRIVIRRDGAAEFPRIDPEELDRICEAVEAFDRS